MTISIIVAVASVLVACLITAFEPQFSARIARPALRRAESVPRESDIVLANRPRQRWNR